MNTFALLLEWVLRLFGVFWIFGGVLTLQQARLSQSMDTVLETLTQEKEDQLLSRFLWIGGVLTLLSGLGLAIATRWVLIPLGLSVGSQIIYFVIKNNRFAQAQTQEERAEAQVAPSTRNAFVVSVVVAIAALIGETLGVLR